MALALGVMVAGTARGEPVSVTLGWEAPEIPPGQPALSGYHIHYGTQSRESAPYDRVVAVGLETQGTVENLVWGQVYYFAVTASNELGMVSAYSTELAWAHGDGDLDGMQDEWEEACFEVACAQIDAGDDPDGDGINNHEEFVAGTDPNNRASALKVDIFPVRGIPYLAFRGRTAKGAGYAGFQRQYCLESLEPGTDTWKPVPRHNTLSPAADQEYAFPVPFPPATGPECRWFRVRPMLAPGA